MEIVLAVLVLSFLIFVALVVLGVRAAKRGIERAGTQVRRTISDATLKARAAQPGAAGELARLRRELRSSLDSTRGVLAAGSADDAALREALGLLDQLHGHARQLDGELESLMNGEPDRARISARLPELRQRTDRIRSSADALRHAAQDRVHHHDADELDALHQQIDLEAKALRHWAPTDPAVPGGSAGTGGAVGSGGSADSLGRGREDEPGLPSASERRQLFRRKASPDA